MSHTIGLISLGCNKNLVDSEQALGLLRERGWTITHDPAEAEVLMVNTCGFIEAAKQESIDTILELAAYKQTGRCRLLVVTGCLAQRYQRELLDAMPEIDLLFGVNQYGKLGETLERKLDGQNVATLWCDDPHTFYEHSRVLATAPWTAYTRIGEGCSNRCTFCAIPLIRGDYRSRDEKAILDEVACLAGQGVREHILVAQDTTRWGTDDGGHTKLPDLMRKAAAIDGVEWLRVLYCYPDEADERLFDVIAQTPNICSYLDLPIQHINDTVLRRMRRRGDSGDIRRCLRQARERGLTLRTSLIVGFPGETEDQFRELLDFVEEAEFDRMGAFAYSAEEGTPAARMPDQIPEEVKRERLDRLLTLQAGISLRRSRARIGETAKVLVTKAEGRGATGRSEREAPETDGEIRLRMRQDRRVRPGEFVTARITDADTYDLMGEIV
ncbi:MAG: 30S ribosomal protein S12 methylthiotransferase RimO [Clostridia bacterium]|nr:30S ribosomal protein S12 methylthiotransferase RimO [Clostridia bacterium]